MVDHDRLFKELLTTFFMEFCELLLPQLAAGLERDSLEFLDKEIFTDVTTGTRYQTDVLVRARWRHQGAFIVLHVEHQSSAQADFNKRMFRYFARLHEKYDLPIYPIALYSYDAPRRAEPERFQVMFPDLDVLDFHFRVIQLNRLNWRDFLNHPNPVAAALMAKMNIAPHERAKVKLECLRLLATLRLDPAQMQLISGFIDTYLKLSDADKEEFQKSLKAEPEEQREEVMQIVTSWMQEGIEKGLQQGLQQGLHQGRQQGEAAFALRLLQRRLGPLPQTVQKRIAKLPSPKLEALGEALLDFQHLRDLRAWLKENT